MSDDNVMTLLPRGESTVSLSPLGFDVRCGLIPIGQMATNVRFDLNGCSFFVCNLVSFSILLKWNHLNCWQHRWISMEFVKVDVEIWRIGVNVERIGCERSAH